MLQSLDAVTEAKENRPKLPEAERKAIAEYAALTPPEVEEISAENFTTLDSYYLEECLLLRDVARGLSQVPDFQKTGLGIEALAPMALPAARFQADLKRARLAFDFICRQIYEELRNVPAAPPWFSLEAGCGSGLDRAYAFLGVLQQLKLDGCLIGPPAIFETPVAQNDNRKDAFQRVFTPIRAVGVRIGKDIYLFDPFKSKAIPGAVGDRIATLAEVRNQPERLKAWAPDWKPEEIKTWEAYLACPLSALAPRLTWVEAALAETNPVQLHCDVLALRDRFLQEAGETKCRFWNPHPRNPNDFSFDLTYPQILRRYRTEQKRALGSLPPLWTEYRQQYDREYIPIGNFMPIMPVRSKNLGPKIERMGQERIYDIYSRTIREILFRYGSPRDRILRGQYNDANLALSTLKDEQDIIRKESAEHSDLDRMYETWVNAANDVYEELAAAEKSGDSAAITAAQTNRSKLEQYRPMILIVLRNASTINRAEIAYLTAVCSHEKAERSQAALELKPSDSLKADAEIYWTNAREYWVAYINNYQDLRQYYPAREAHAKLMLKRCEQFVTEPEKKTEDKK